MAVLDPKKGKALRAAVAKAERAGHTLGEPDLKRVPRGFDPEHPNADFLRYKGIWVHQTGTIPKEIFGPAAVALVVARFREMKPLQQWLAAAIG